MSKDLTRVKQRGFIRATGHYLKDPEENLALRLMMGGGIVAVLDDPAAAFFAALTAASVVFPPLIPIMGTITAILATIAFPDNWYLILWGIMMLFIFGKKINEHRYL